VITLITRSVNRKNEVVSCKQTLFSSIVFSYYTLHYIKYNTIKNLISLLSNKAILHILSLITVITGSVNNKKGDISTKGVNFL